MIDETLFDAEEQMEKAVSVARDDLSSIRTGRANPGMFNRINVDYYGSTTPITGTCAAVVICSSARAVAVLHAMTSICAPRSSR